MIETRAGNRIAIMNNENKKAVLFFKSGQMSGLDRWIFYIMIAATLCVFLNSGLQIITGPILAVCFTYLYFKGYQPLVAAIIVVANDSLGCIFTGSISFTYLLLVLFIISIFFDHFVIEIRNSQIVAGIIVIIMLLTLLYYETIAVKNIVYTVTFICAVGYNLREYEDIELFFKGVAIVAFLISIHTCITGGVEFYELDEYSTEYLRKGILGAGIGDSNYSALLLNLGIACALFDKDFRWYLKLIMTVCAVYAMTVTLSTSGLIGLLLALFAFVLLKRDSLPKRLFNVIILIFILLIIYNTYMGLSDNMRNETVDAYIERMQEKSVFLQQGEMTEFTTNRSDLANESMDYILHQQGALGELFGFNSLFAGTKSSVPHNTYIDLLLQIGFTGTFVSMGYILYAGVMAWKDKQRSRRDILLKIIFLYYFLNLSIYQGSIFALAYLVLIVL